MKSACEQSCILRQCGMKFIHTKVTTQPRLLDIFTEAATSMAASFLGSVCGGVGTLGMHNQLLLCTLNMKVV